MIRQSFDSVTARSATPPRPRVGDTLCYKSLNVFENYRTILAITFMSDCCRIDGVERVRITSKGADLSHKLHPFRSCRQLSKTELLIRFALYRARAKEASNHGIRANSLSESRRQRGSDAIRDQLVEQHHLALQFALDYTPEIPQSGMLACKREIYRSGACNHRSVQHRPMRERSGKGIGFCDREGDPSTLLVVAATDKIALMPLHCNRHSQTLHLANALSANNAPHTPLMWVGTLTVVIDPRTGPSSCVTGKVLMVAKAKADRKALFVAPVREGERVYIATEEDDHVNVSFF